MTQQSMFLPPAIHRYILDNSLREPPVLARLRAETASLTQGYYQIAPEEGQMLTLVLELLRARRTLDIGVFTGYSATVAALALPPEGRVVACDVSVEWTDVARRYWAEAGVADKIDLRLAPATETLSALIGEGAAGSFDFALIDADKELYPTYYEQALTLVRPGGVIAIDNTLWRGTVADPEATKPKTETFRAFNAFVHADERVTQVLLPLGDGLTLARKRP
ncbi:class I SAM-dependent methyltransferase [Skermanella pratensis]|uniref:class I SAM-dependent methyltransferase n=1 Tax=Skermanella pratensis TaxID=2233999 RepID=UPI00130128B9|nr:class I SAM-dependent methyltransferase [Skermanella pratensis]